MTAARRKLDVEASYRARASSNLYPSRNCPIPLQKFDTAYRQSTLEMLLVIICDILSQRTEHMGLLDERFTHTQSGMSSESCARSRRVPDNVRWFDSKATDAYG